MTGVAQVCGIQQLKPGLKEERRAKHNAQIK